MGRALQRNVIGKRDAEEGTAYGGDVKGETGWAL